METINCRLPGDYYQFGPLGLGKDPTFLKWYREAKLIHGRRAMATVVGIFVGHACSGIPWLEAGADREHSPIHLRFPYRDLTHPHGVCRLLQPGFTPWSKTAENFANAMGEQGYPRGKFFGPCSLTGTIKYRVYLPDMEKLERLKLDEIKHARIATLAMLIFIL